MAGVHAYLYGERAIMNRETGGFLPITVLFILAERAQLVKSRDEPSIVAIKTALFRFGAARGSHMLLDTAARDTTFWSTRMRFSKKG